MVGVIEGFRWALLGEEYRTRCYHNCFNLRVVDIDDKWPLLF